MEKELNIAAILKGKPKARLYDELHNIKVELDKVSTINDVTTIWCKRELPNKVQHFGYSERGTERGWLDGLQILFPSKQMRDWEKFAWKKGDVLIYSDILVIFDKWANDDYSEFKAAFEFKRGSNYFDKGNIYYTSEFCKAIDETANYFIKEIEEHYGGKLNLETLEIEKPEFKDGDIVCFYGGRGCYDAIAIIKEQEKETFNVYTFIEVPIMKLYYQYNNFYPYTRKARLATDSEKQQLFDALAKKGKRWNAETKTLENLPKKCEFKPKDWCLMRDFNETWKLCQFGFMEKGHVTGNALYNAVGGNTYEECIPYNDQTAHLLGTTDDWKGGEE